MKTNGCTITNNYGLALITRKISTDRISVLTNSMAYGTRRFNAAFTRVFQ